MLRQKIKYLLYILFLLNGLTAAAQEFLSPFSKFGLGELQPATLVNHQSLGGTSIATLDSNGFSLNNPASYSRMRSFAFETALSGRFYEIQSSQDKYRNKDYLLPYFAFAIPLDSHLRWGLSFGLLQYSKIGYEFQESYTFNSSVNPGSTLNYNEIFSGTGGYSKFYIGTSIQTIKNLFLGANVGYFFGKQEVTQRIEFPDSTTLTTLQRNSAVNIGDFVFDLGLIYHLPLKHGNHFQIGASATLGANLKARQDIFDNTYLNIGGQNLLYDSLSRTLQAKGSVKLPARYGVGFQWHNKTWLVGADVNYQPWSQFRYLERNDSLKDLTSVSFGLQWTPQGAKEVMTQTYLGRMSYRIGAKITNSYFNLNNDQPTDLRLTAGFGLPVGRGGSSINVGLEYGQLGSISNNEIRQRYFAVSFGFHLFDPNWFYRRKIE